MIYKKMKKEKKYFTFICVKQQVFVIKSRPLLDYVPLLFAQLLCASPSVAALHLPHCTCLLKSKCVIGETCCLQLSDGVAGSC